MRGIERRMVHPQTPTIDRTLVLAGLILGLLVAPPFARAQTPGARESAGGEETWTAEDAVARAMANPEVQVILEGRLAATRADVAEATVVPTPRLGVTHEQVYGDEDVAYLETSAMLEQRFDLSGWREELRETLPHREDAVRAETDAWRLDVATQVRRAFFAVRYHQERVRALDGWIARLEQGAEAIAARQARGDAALYDVRRVERELVTARAVRARAVAQLTQAWGDLGTWAPWTTPPDLVGTLTPEAPESDEEGSLPRLARLQALELALGAEVEAWGAPFWRDWTLGAGYRYAEVGAVSGHGVLVSLSVPLTLWNPHRPRIERLRAEQTRIAGELRLERSVAERAAAGARARLENTLDALAQLPPRERDAELTRLAETAYAAGEATLTELLDAHESETDLELSRIDLQWEARRAAIELDRRRGLGVPE